MSQMVAVVYVALVLMGIAWNAFLIMSRSFERMDVPHMLFLLFVFSFLSIGMVLRAISPFIVLGGLAMLPVVVFIMDFMRETDERKMQQTLLRDELRKARDFMQLHPEDSFAYVQHAEVYEKIGEYGLAAQFFDRAAEQESKDRFKVSALQQRATLNRKEKFQRMVSPIARYNHLCACLRCGGILFRRKTICDECGNRTFPTGLMSFWILMREGLESDFLVAVVSAGMLSLPFLNLLGRWPHEALWAIWSLAFWLTFQQQKQQERS